MTDPIHEPIWFVDPTTGDHVLLYPDEIDPAVYPQIFRPVGGFCYPADVFANLPLPSVPFLVHGIIPRQGKALIYAPPKSGKSFLAVQMCRCVASGDDFINIPTQQGRALYIQGELGQEVLQARMRATRQRYPDVYVGTTFAMKLDLPNGQRYLQTALDAVRPDLLVLDPLYKLVSGDMNESSDMLKITNFIDDMIELYHVSVLIMHHTGKDIGRRGIGSSVMEDWVDSYIEMKRTSHSGEPLKISLTPKMMRHDALPDGSIDAELTGFEFVPTDGLTNTVRLQVERFIASKGRVSPSQILSEKIGSNTSVYAALRVLLGEKKIQREGKGEYIWCPKSP